MKNSTILAIVGGAFIFSLFFVLPWGNMSSLTNMGPDMMDEYSTSGSVTGYSEPYMMGVPMMAEEASYDSTSKNSIRISPPIPAPSAGQTAGEVDQKIIKNGSLTLVVDNVSETIESLTQLSKTVGGFVQTSDVFEGTNGQKSGNITLRIPSSGFETALKQAKDMATFVSHEQVSGQDVTEQYIDLAARLRNAEAQEQVYLTVLDSARSVSDVLEVQRELSNIRATIESYKGQIQYLENQTSYATLSIFLSESTTVSLPTKEFRPLEAIKEAANSLVVVAQSLIVTIIWFVIVGGGILLPLGLIAWVIYLIVRSYLNNKKPKTSKTLRR